MSFKIKFQGKKVLVTGQTGFKGSWLCAWLNNLGAKVFGIALEPSTVPSHFEVLNLEKRIKNKFIDIRNLNQFSEKILDVNPDFIFHLAAQPLVKESYDDPLKTYETNFIGTLNLLETLRKLKKKCVVVLITSDKCYENKEWIWGYKETDQIGGIDPYSASKGACEIMIKSHIKSFFDNDSLVKIGIGRAGNVIGGGDWSGNRIVPDAVKSWAKKKTLILRNPQSTRPWQHVLEPLSGYLELACKLSYENSTLHGEAFNFGPPSDQSYSVKHLIKEMSKHWNGAKWEDKNNKNKSFYESGLLKLNCDKALALLNWKPTLNFEQTVELTTIWYKKYYTKSLSKINNITFEQIELFEKFRNEKGKRV